ncbi:MAG: ParB/RepB/Spo0J family partition protein [Cyanobacteria bacterium P01_D01_bin.115]
MPKPQLRNVAALLNRDEAPAENSQTVAIAQIQLPKSQPRRYFDEEKLAQLVQSVKAHGVLERLLVRPIDGADSKYELVAGERRLRAAKAAGLEVVPVSTRSFTDQEALQVALMENLQREDLNPVEETEAIMDLLALTLDMPRDEVAALFYQAHNAKHRGQELRQNVLSQLEQIESLLTNLGRFNIDSFRASRLPLLKLPMDVLEVLRQGKLEYTKAQAIARIKDDQQRSTLLSRAVKESLPVSVIKSEVKALKEKPEGKTEQTVYDRYQSLGQRLKKSAVWEDRKKRDRLAKLLNDIEKLLDA